MLMEIYTNVKTLERGNVNMSKFERFEDIAAWKEGCRLATRIYEITKTEKFSKDWGLKEQIQRAAVSIPSNISEGFERDSRQEFIRFLFIAKGSAGEVRTQLYIAKNLEYIDARTFDGLIDKAKYVSSLIANLIKYLRER